MAATIAETMHDHAREQAHLPAGVRLYKRSIAPLAQVVEVQGYEQFGFVLYRTWYDNETAYNEFMDALQKVNEVQMAGEYRGTGLELVREKFLMPTADEKEMLDGADMRTCAKYVINTLALKFYVKFLSDTSIP